MFHRSPVHLISIPTSVFGFPKFTLVDDPGCPKSHSFGNKSSMRWDASISKTGRIHIFLHFYWSELKIVIESILTKNGFGKILGGFPFSKLWLTEEEKVGGRVADELQERLPHYLPIIIIIISRQWSDEHDERYICLRIGEALTDPTGYLFTHHHHHHHHQHLHYHHLWKRCTRAADVTEGVEGKEEANPGNLHSLHKIFIKWH